MVINVLVGKGLVTSRLTDKAGVAFVTPRVVGAYEYVPSPTSLIKSVEEDQARFYLSNGKRVSVLDGKAIVINLLDAILWNGNISDGQIIGLLHGAYVIRSTTERGTSIQKTSL